MVDHMQEIIEDATMVTKKDQDVLNNWLSVRGRAILSLFLYFFLKWYNNRIYLFENQSFDNQSEGEM